MNIIKYLKSQNISELSEKSGVARSSIHRFITNKNDLGFNKISELLFSQKKVLITQPTLVDSTLHISYQLLDGSDWRISLFNFVDRFRFTKDPAMVKYPPVIDLEPKLQALIASTVCQLCSELKIPIPKWAMNPDLHLKEPWFVAGVENLKAMALIESPMFYRKNNIFVLDNFLSRA